MNSLAVLYSILQSNILLVTKVSMIPLVFNNLSSTAFKLFCRDCDQLATLQKKGAGRKISVETGKEGEREVKTDGPRGMERGKRRNKEG